MTYEMFEEENLSQVVQKNPAKYWYRIFLLKHIVQLGIRKNYVSKLSLKMFIKNQCSKSLCLPNASEF